MTCMWEKKEKRENEKGKEKEGEGEREVAKARVWMAAVRFGLEMSWRVLVLETGPGIGSDRTDGGGQ